MEKVEKTNDGSVQLSLQCPEDDRLIIEYEVLPVIAESDPHYALRQKIFQCEANLDARLNVLNQRLEELNKDLSRLENHADGIDYLIAVSSGIFAGMIDSFFVGELGLFKDSSSKAKSSFQATKDEVHMQMNKFIERYARAKGYNQPGGLKGSIVYLEKNYSVAQDNIWKGQEISSAKTHHLDDLAHHPTLLGLFSAIIVQYLGIAVFADSGGQVHFKSTYTDPNDVLENLTPFIFCGLIKWLVNLAEQQGTIHFDAEVPAPIQKLVANLHKAPIAISVLKTTDNWLSHLVSDMGGANSTPGGGAGIPGLFGSFLKELSMLPGMQRTNLPKTISTLYQGTNNSPLSSKLDLRTELAVAKKQKMPVLINELIVRTCYFVRRLISGSAKAQTMSDIDWEEVLPFGTRTIARMLTISTGTFVAVDLADAAINAIAKPGTSLPSGFMLRVNFVGIGRFAVACGTDIYMGIQYHKVDNQIIQIYAEYLHLYNAKVFYRQANMWISAIEAGQAIQAACESMQKAFYTYDAAQEDIQSALNGIGEIAKETSKRKFSLFGRSKKGKKVIDEILEEL